MMIEGCGIRTISRLTGLHQRTVLNVLEVIGDKCERLLAEKVRNVDAKFVQTDELFSYVGKHPDNCAANDPKQGAFYCYLTVDRDSKLIINHRIAKRDSDNCRLVMEDLKRRVNGTFQLSTDGFNGYAGSVGQVFGKNIHYGTESQRPPAKPEA